MAYKMELLAETRQVAAVRFSGTVQTDAETAVSYDVAGSCTAIVEAMQKAKALSLVNLSTQVVTYQSVPAVARYYDHLVGGLVGTTPKGGTITVPSQLHAHWRERVNKTVELSSKMETPTLFVLEVPTCDELYDRSIAVHLHQFSTAVPHAIVFLQDDKPARFEVDEAEGGGRRAFKALRAQAHDVDSLLGRFETTPPGEVFVDVTPPMRGGEAAKREYLHATFGAHKLSESARTQVYEKALVIPTHFKFSTQLSEWLDANECVCDGPSGVEWGIHSGTLKFKVAGGYEKDGWTITLLLLKVAPSGDALQECAQSPRCLEETTALVKDLTELVRTDYADKNAVFKLMQADHSAAFGAHVDLQRICTRILNRARSEWRVASDAFDNKAYLPVLGVPKRTVEMPSRMLSTAGY